MIPKRQQIIEVVPHDPNWQTLFKKEAIKLQTIFGNNFVEAIHIGSTSIPDMPAKPTIDIMLIVKNIETVDTLNPQMEDLGYEAWGEYKIPGRRFFVKGNDKRTHHVHTFQEGDDNIFRHIAFRDYLIAHPKVMAEYAKLKQNLAHKYKHNRRQYVVEKSKFVESHEAKAIQWAK